MIELHDIFSNKKLENKEPLHKEKIEVYYREKNSLIPSELISLGLELEFKELKIGDYITKGVVIERKTVSDFISSMLNKRLITQLEHLQDIQKKLLIIEGIEEQELYSDNFQTGLHPNSVRGFLLSILLKYNTPIIFSKNAEDTAKFISLIAKKKDIETSKISKRKARSIKEQMQFILEGFPNIGPKTAKKLLKHFRSIKNIITTEENELKKIIGKKAESFKKIINKDFN